MKKIFNLKYILIITTTILLNIFNTSYSQNMDKLYKKIRTRMERLRIGNPLDKSIDMGAIIDKGQLKVIADMVQLGVDEGSTLCQPSWVSPKEGYFYPPTMFTDVSPSATIAQEEIFGPVLSILECRSLDNAVEIVNDSRFGLSSAIYTRDVNRAFKAIEKLDTGITYINSSTIGAEVQLPFGGTKGTGNGHREAGTTALEIFTEWKSVFIDYSGGLQKAQIED